MTKANQVIVRNDNNATLLNLTKDSGDFEFAPAIKSIKTGTTTNTGLAISYSSSNSNVVQVTGAGARLKMVGGELPTITASQAVMPDTMRQPVRHLPLRFLNTVRIRIPYQG